MSATPSDSVRGDDSTTDGALARALADAHVAWLASERERAIGVLTAFVETKVGRGASVGAPRILRARSGSQR